MFVLPAKIFFQLIFVFLLLSFTYGQEFGLNMQYEKILDCQLAGFNACNLILSPIYKYTTAVSNFGVFNYQFPPDGPYSDDWIDCSNKKDITLAEYNGETWIPIPSIVGDDHFVRADINRLGTFALIRSEQCVITGCGFRGYSLSPFTGNVRVGRSITFNLCGLIPGCNPEDDGLCSNRCTQNIDPDCGECTNKGGDCCLLSKDNVCDNDCGEFDPDCSRLSDKCSFTNGICDPECPSREVRIGNTLLYTWFADPDCSLLKTGTGGADGICVPLCDTKCDPDCIVGIDPDCPIISIAYPGQIENWFKCSYCGDSICSPQEAANTHCQVVEGVWPTDCDNKCGECGSSMANLCDLGYTEFCPQDTSGGNGDIYCFLYGTLVLMADGTTKKIEDIKIGEKLIGFDERLNKIKETKVTSILKDHPREFYYIINNEIKVTNDHPLAVFENNKIKWVKVEDLKVGYIIKSLNGFVIVNALDKIQEEAITANLETDVGNYFVQDSDGRTYLAMDESYILKK